MFPILFHIGPITLHTYGLLVAAGFLVAFQVARRSFPLHGLPLEAADQLSLYLMIAGIIGARVFYFGTLGWEDLTSDPWAFFRVWEGGLVFYGGVLGGLIALVIFARVQGYPVLTLADALVPALLIGHAIGRLGCFAAGCCYGKPSDLPWAVAFTHPDCLAPRFVPLHPTQLYCSAVTAGLFWAALVLERRRPARGILCAFYLVSYGAARFSIEFLRGDDRGRFVDGLSPSQWISVAAVAAGILLFSHARRTRAD